MATCAGACALEHGWRSIENDRGVYLLSALANTRGASSRLRRPTIKLSQIQKTLETLVRRRRTLTISRRVCPPHQKAHRAGVETYARSRRPRSHRDDGRSVPRRRAPSREGRRGSGEDGGSRGFPPATRLGGCDDPAGAQEVVPGPDGEASAHTTLEWLAYAYFHAGDPGKALELYRALLRDPDPDPTHHVFAAACLSTSGGTTRRRRRRRTART